MTPEEYTQIWNEYVEKPSRSNYEKMQKAFDEMYPQEVRDTTKGKYSRENGMNDDEWLNLGGFYDKRNGEIVLPLRDFRPYSRERYKDSVQDRFGNWGVVGTPEEKAEKQKKWEEYHSSIRGEMEKAGDSYEDWLEERYGTRIDPATNQKPEEPKSTQQNDATRVSIKESVPIKKRTIFDFADAAK